MMGKIMMGLVLAAMIVSMNAAPALSKDNNQGSRSHDSRGHNEQRGNVGHNEHDRRMHRPRHDGYRGQGYDPPPVVYAPPAPLGIGIFVPPIFISR